MGILRRALLAFALAAGLAPAFAQAPPPVPALPDTERRTTYSLNNSICSCSVGFALYGDSTDYGNWVEVFVNGVIVPSTNWSITSPSGGLQNIPRPITDGVLTFVAPQTGTVQIVGARRPRRTILFQENRGVAARDLNQAVNDIVAMLREDWDKINDVTGRAVLAAPGETLALLPAKTARASQGACFDSNGNLTNCVSIPSSTFAAGTGITFTGTNPTTISVTQSGTLLNGALIAKTAAYSAASGDCGSTINLSGSAQYTLTIGAPSSYLSTCAFLVTNAATETSSKTLALSGLSTCFLWPGQSALITNQGNIWVMNPGPVSANSASCVGRWRLNTATTVYIRHDGSDTLCDGLTNQSQASASGEGCALKSAATAALFVVQNFDLNGRSDMKMVHTCGSPPCTINTASELMILPITPGLSTSSIAFVGGIPTYDGDPAGTTLSAPSGCCDIQIDYQAISLNIGTHFTYAGSPTSAGLYLGGGVFANLLGGNFGNISAGSSTTSHILVNSKSNLFILGNYTVSGAPGSAGAQVFAEFGGYIEIGAGVVVTCTASPTMAAWAVGASNGIITAPSMTFSGCGSVTAQKFVSNTAGGVNTNGGATVFPGNVAGAATSPGWTQ